MIVQRTLGDCQSTNLSHNKTVLVKQYVYLP